MEIPDVHFRHILLYYFRKGKKAVQARKKLYDVYDEKSLTKRRCQNWFSRFRFDLKDGPRSGRPTEVDDDKIKEMIEFLKGIITDYEKWVVYDNVVRKRSWSKRDEPAQSVSKESYAECLVGF